MASRMGFLALRRTLAGVTATILVVATLALGSGSASPAAADVGPIEPGEAWMGVGVQMYEGAGGAPTDRPITIQASVDGIDVSSHQGNVAWSTLWSRGNRFAYVKATEGTAYRNPYFAQQYNGSYNVGMIRGAYHFALPNGASGAAQADFFASNGGGWSRDGKTLPGTLDIEYNPYGSICYGLSDSAMVSWIRSFLDRYFERTGRWAVIYTTTNWWSDCTGNYGGFASNSPLWIARYASSAGPLPAGWGSYTFWQYTASGPVVGDHDLFNGSLENLQALANDG